MDTWIINRIHKRRYFFSFSHLRLLFLSHLSRDSMVSGSKASSSLISIFSLISVFSLISTTLSHLAKTHDGEGPRRADLRPMKGGNETHDGEGEQRGLWRNRPKTPPPKSHYNNAETPKQREFVVFVYGWGLEVVGFWDSRPKRQKSQTHTHKPQLPSLQ